MSIINKNLNLNLNVNFKSSLIKNTKEEESDKKDETLNDSNDNSSLFHDTSNDLVKNIDNNLILTTRNIKIDSINSALQKDSVNKIVAGQPQIKSNNTNNTNNFSGTSITSSLSEALKEVEKNIYTDEDILKKIQEMCPDMSISNLSEYEETISCVLLSESAQGASQEKIIYMISSALNLGIQEELNDAEKIATELLSKLGNSLQTYLSNNSYVTFDSLTESLKQQNCTDEEIEICKKLITTYLSETFNGVFDVDQINRALNSNGIKIKNDSNNSLAVSISSSEAPSGFWISVGRFCSWLSSTTGYNAIMVVADYTPVSVIASAVDVGVTLSGVYYSMTYDREAYGREWLNGQDASQEECLDAAKNRAIFEAACAIFGILPGFTAGALRKAFGNAPQKLFESLMANFDAILDELDKLNDIKTLKEFFRYVKEGGWQHAFDMYATKVPNLASFLESMFLFLNSNSDQSETDSDDQVPETNITQPPIDYIYAPLFGNNWNNNSNNSNNSNNYVNTGNKPSYPDLPDIGLGDYSIPGIPNPTDFSGLNGNNDATVPIPEGETGSVKADGNLVFNSKNDGNELVYIVSNPDQQIEDKINELIDKYSDYNCEIDVNIDSDGFLNWTVKVLGPKDYTDGNNLVNNGNLSNDTNSDDSISEPLPPAFNPYDYINQDGSFNVDDFINDALENGWDYTTIIGNNNIEEAWGDILDAYNSGNWDDFYNNAFSGAYTGNDSKNDDENYNGYDGINGDFNVFETGGGGGSAGSNNMWDNFLQDPSSYFRNQANGMINNNSYKDKIFTMNNKFGV